MKIIDTIRTARDRRRRYHSLVAEIQALSDREADDVGISRHDAHRIAHASVYG